MPNTLVNTRDVRFVLFEQLQIDEFLLPELREDYDLETLEMVIGEAEKLAVNVLAPTNKDGDKMGCRFEEGKVFLPPSFLKAYELVLEGGWNVISDTFAVSQSQPTTKPHLLSRRHNFPPTIQR